ncbi:hypothetical protein BA895_17180 [Humibacillus sp. DSM 29435]|uniref:hypothetical protein n=1 Tax=Humibacillus sp. DSM 29435 TaxID=1869167 RepID=UPI000872E294|nr:hypothetical protein [Humibacillus sp. DSM 29435]OFE17193.1 hypothetical protein BA895_17180 [Humibacillus sp. DSM 29435]
MGLRRRLAILAVDATHVLVIESPGAWLTRVAIEREIDRRGWRLATSPADADALVTVGTPGPELSERIESVWEQLPGPRSRTVIAGDTNPASVRKALDQVAAELLDPERQVGDARDREGFGSDQMSDDSDLAGDMDMHGDSDMDMDMSPSGIPLAEGGNDRDGLEMDALHLPLGPVLPHWPAGVVLRCTLQGDVVVAADASVLDESDCTPVLPHPNERAAWCCDQLARVLALSGWVDGYSAAVRVRDALIDQQDAAASSALLDVLQRRLRRARLLRWSLRDIGNLRADDQPDAPPQLHGDVYERLMSLSKQASAELTRDAASSATPAPVPVLLAVAERLVVGLDLAAARLVVASLAIDVATTSDLAPHQDEEARDA